MITRIDLQSFGCYQNMIWRQSVKDPDGQITDFKKFNIIYGRNYTGKTTLSRLFQSLEIGQLSSGYSDQQFLIKTDAGDISPTNIGNHPHNVRVFNTDFVNNNLSFLRSEDGTIKPFAVLGDDNSKLEYQIESKEKQLGEEDKGTGLYSERSKSRSEWKNKKQNHQAETDKRTEKLRLKANKDIKTNILINDVNYNIKKIEIDLEKVFKNDIPPLSHNEESELTQTLKQESLPEISPLPQLNLNLSRHCNDINNILLKEIRPTNALKELVDNSLLQEWVKRGMSLHRDQRDTCGFCGNPLPDSLWEKLDDHFNREFQELEASIKTASQDIENELTKLNEIKNIDEKSFYPIFREEFKSLNSILSAELSKYRTQLTHLDDELKSRLSDPLNSRTSIRIDDNSDAIKTSIQDLNKLIEKQNEKTGTLSSDQEKSRETLRLGLISRFASDIDLATIDSNIEKLKEEKQELEKKYSSLDYKVEQIEKEIKELKSQLHDESRGARKVNQYLAHHFGNQGLRLEPVEDTDPDREGVKFEVRRGHVKAYNLSEGECSLLAFCYFVASLEGTESQGKDLIIYIDDPVSSLDSDHIFFVYSLIHGLITNPTIDQHGSKKDRYKQLFISTHNLDFLKFAKRLPKPGHGGKGHFIIERSDCGSIIKPMPHYLRQYVTEFHYLFDQICSCTSTEKMSNDHHCFYSFGNNLRKFLEIYLFFKYPFCENSSGEHNKRLKRFFDDDPASEPMVNRVTNELSHLEESFDRGVRPIENSEISKMALFVLKKIKAHDEDQYSDLLQATNWHDPLSTS